MSTHNNKIPKTMKAVKLVKLVGKYSDTEEVKQCFQVVTDEPVPQPKSGEVLIRVQRCQINPSDTSFCQGRYGVKRDPPCIPGFEGVGIVVATKGLLAWRLMGKRVSFFTTGGGGWSEYVTQDHMKCLEVGNTSWSNAAGAVVNPFTVMEMIRIAEAGKHTSFIATAGSSSLVLQLLKIAKAHNIRSIAIVRKADQIQECLTAGATYALDSSAEDFVSKLESASNELKCRLAFDSVAGDVGGQVFSALQDYGEMHVYGFLSGKPVQCTGKDLIFRKKIMKGLWANQIFKLPFYQLYTMRNELISRLDTELSTQVRATYPLDKIVDALLEYTKTLSGGKIQIICGDYEKNEQDGVVANT
jgi:NADPH2:quinone reductase